MIKVSASEEVSVSPEEIWSVLCDTSRYAEWVAGTDAVTRTDGPAAVGVTYDEINPILGPWKSRTLWTVVDFDPPHRQRHTTADVPLSSEFEVVMEVAPEGGGSRVTLTLTGTPSLGPVGALFARLMTGMVARDNRKSLENLARLVERENQAAVA